MDSSRNKNKKRRRRDGGGKEEESQIRKEETRENREPWTQEGTKTERGGGGGRGSEEAILTREEGRANPGYWNWRRGRGEECKDKGGYPDKARENHSKVQDYCCKEMIRMQGLPAPARTQ